MTDKRIKDRMFKLMLEMASIHRERKEIEERAEQIWLELSDKVKNGSLSDEDTEAMRSMGTIYGEKCKLVEGERSVLISKMLLLVLDL